MDFNGEEFRNFEEAFEDLKVIFIEDNNDDHLVDLNDIPINECPSLIGGYRRIS